MPDRRWSPEENSRLLSVYMRPWTLNAMNASEANPLLSNLGRGTGVTGVSASVGTPCPSTPRNVSGIGEPTGPEPKPSPMLAHSSVSPPVTVTAPIEGIGGTTATLEGRGEVMQEIQMPQFPPEDQQEQNQNNKEQDKEQDQEQENEEDQEQENEQDQKNKEQEDKNQEQEENEEQQENQEQQQQQEAFEEEKSQDLKQAESILDALKQDEKIMQKQKISRSKSRKLVKDW